MLQIGITGGIGAGKSIICKIFNCLNIPIYNADDAAKKLMRFDLELRKNLQNEFGVSIFPDSCDFNKKELAKVVFNNSIELEKLNNLVHPAVKKNYLNWLSKQSAPYVLKEAAILFESGSSYELNYIILVDAPISLRIERIKKRDNRSTEEITAIINQQWSSSKTKDLANFIIENNNITPVIPQVLSIHHQLIYGFN